MQPLHTSIKRRDETEIDLFTSCRLDQDLRDTNTLPDLLGEKQLCHGLKLLLDGVKSPSSFCRKTILSIDLFTDVVFYFERSISRDDARRRRISSLADVMTQCVNVLPEILEEKQQNRRW